MNSSRNEIDPGGRIVFFGGYDPGYPRNSIIRKGLERLGVPVASCNAGNRRKIFTRYPILAARRLASRRGGDLYFVPEFRHKDVPLASMLARLSGGRVVFDPLVSRYETRVMDRGDVVDGSFQSRHNRNIDRISMRLPDLLLSDTDAHARFYSREFGVDRGRIRVLHIGFDDDYFHQSPPRGDDGIFRVLFYGSYLPLHGVDTIVGAAEILAGAPVSFTLVGGGQTFSEAKQRSSASGSRNTRFVDYVAPGELESMIAGSDIVLGVFGKTEKTQMVIPNKVFQAMAVGRAVISCESPAIGELFTDRENIITVPAGDSSRLAEAVESLRANAPLREKVAGNGCSLVRNGYSPERVARSFLEILAEEGMI